MAWKSKPLALIPARISNPVWMKHVNFYSGKHQGHKSPTVNVDLALKDPKKSLRRIACDALETASWSPRPFARHEGCALKSAFLHRLKGRVLSPRPFTNLKAPFIKLKKPEPRPLSDKEPCPLNDPESHLLSDPGPRSSTFQSRILKSASFHKPEGRVPFIRLKNAGLRFSQTI